MGVNLEVDIGGLDSLLGLRLVDDATSATRETLSEALLGSGDGKGRGGEEDLAEERGSEHGVQEGERVEKGSNGLAELGMSRAQAEG